MYQMQKKSAAAASSSDVCPNTARIMEDDTASARGISKQISAAAGSADVPTASAPGIFTQSGAAAGSANVPTASARGISKPKRNSRKGYGAAWQGKQLRATTTHGSATTNGSAMTFSPEQRAAASAIVQETLENIKRKSIGLAEAQVPPPPPVIEPVLSATVFEYDDGDLPMCDDEMARIAMCSEDWSSVMQS